MLKIFKKIIYIFIFLETFSIPASQLPTLTSLCSQAAMKHIETQLNGHNWRHIQTQLKTMLPQEAYELIIKKFKTSCKTKINPTPSLTLQQQEGVTALSLPAENYLMAESCLDSIHIWDLYRGRDIYMFDNLTTRRSTIYLSPDKQIVVFTHAQGNIFVRDLPNRRDLGVLSGHTGAINTVAFSHDSKLLISGSADQTIRIWDIEHGRLLHVCEGHTGSINSVALSEDKEYIVSGSDDQTVKTWLVATGELVSTVEGHNDAVSSVALSPQGETIASGSAHGTICIWQTLAHHDPLENLSRLIASQKGYLEQLKFVIHKYPLSIYSSLVTLGIISSLLSYYIATL